MTFFNSGDMTSPSYIQEHETDILHQTRDMNSLNEDESDEQAPLWQKILLGLVAVSLWVGLAYHIIYQDNREFFEQHPRQILIAIGIGVAGGLAAILLRSLSPQTRWKTIFVIRASLALGMSGLVVWLILSPNSGGSWYLIALAFIYAVIEWLRLLKGWEDRPID